MLFCTHVCALASSVMIYDVLPYERLILVQCMILSSFYDYLAYNCAVVFANFAVLCLFSLCGSQSFNRLMKSLVFISGLSHALVLAFQMHNSQNYGTWFRAIFPVLIWDSESDGIFIGSDCIRFVIISVTYEVYADVIGFAVSHTGNRHLHWLWSLPFHYKLLLILSIHARSAHTLKSFVNCFKRLNLKLEHNKHTDVHRVCICMRCTRFKS